MAMEELAWETFGPAEQDSSDRDIDALHVLPLTMVSVESEAPREFKLIKNRFAIFSDLIGMKN